MYARIFLLAATAVLLWPSLSPACGFDGHIEYGDGSKPTGGIRITTSWDYSERAQFPRPGYYYLELGPRVCGEKIELFVNGDSMGRYRIPSSGMMPVHIKMNGNRPVR